MRVGLARRSAKSPGWPWPAVALVWLASAGGCAGRGCAVETPEDDTAAPEDTGPCRGPAPDHDLREEAWRVSSTEACGGYHVDGREDLDGDGQIDLVFGVASPVTSTGEDFDGQVLLFPGPIDGPRTEAHASVVIRGVDINLTFGFDVEQLGDADGDGWQDLLVGEYGGGPPCAYLFAGPLRSDLTTEDAVAVLHAVDGASGDDYLTARGVGDLNGDGLADVAIGIPWLDPLNRVYLEYGPLEGEHSLGDDGNYVEGHGEFGWSMQGVGDTDGDGLDDVWTSAWGESTFVPIGGAAVLRAGPAEGRVLDFEAEGGVWGDEWDEVGLAVGRAGDVNQDGYQDMLTTVNGNGEGAGGGDAFSGDAEAVLVYGPLHEHVSIWDVPALRMTMHGSCAHSIDNLTGPGDLDLDGWPDLVLAAAGEDMDARGTGVLWVVFGPEQGVVNLPDEAVSLAGEAFDNVGFESLDPLGDLDGDGTLEFAAHAYAFHQESCVSYLVPGSLWAE